MFRGRGEILRRDIKMTRKTTIQIDTTCDNCLRELPIGTDCLTDDENNLVFCDAVCADEYYSILEGSAGE